jgi:hypothetical protein
MHQIFDSLVRAANITPSNSATLGSQFSPAAPHARRLHIGTGGTVVVVTLEGDQATYTAQSGEYLRVECLQVLATGTTASNIVAEY